MRAVKYVPREIYVLVEFSLKELVMLETILRNTQFNYDGDNPAHLEAKEYLENDLYQNVKKAISEVASDVAGS